MFELRPYNHWMRELELAMRLPIGLAFASVLACGGAQPQPQPPSAEWPLGSSCSAVADPEFFAARQHATHEAATAGSHAIPATDAPFPSGDVASACGGVA